MTKHQSLKIDIYKGEEVVFKHATLTDQNNGTYILYISDFSRFGKYADINKEEELKIIRCSDGKYFYVAVECQLHGLNEDSRWVVSFIPDAETE